MGFWVFLFVNHFSEDGVNGNHNVTCSPSLAENDFDYPDFDCSRIAREIAMVSGFFVELYVALFLKVTRMRKIIKSCEANSTSRLLPETGRSQSNEP